MRPCSRKTTLSRMHLLLAAGAIMMSSNDVVAQSAEAGFGPTNPFYAPSTLPFQAPPFDKIKDSDYQPAIEAGMAEQLKEVRAIAENPAAPTFENTVVAMEKTGDLLNRVSAAFNGIAGANTNPVLEKLQEIEAPKLAAHQDAIYLDAKLFQRFATIYKERSSLMLDAESLRLVEYYYQQFEIAGANLSDADKDRLKKLNEEESSLSNAFRTKVLAATKDGAYATTDKAALAGLSESQIGGAAELAKSRKKGGYVLAMQNTTQQPFLASLSDRATRQAVFEDSWTRAEKGNANDTRATIARLAQVRTEQGKLLGFNSYAGWKLQDQMAKTPENALKFMDALVPAATAKAASEAKDIQAVIDAQKSGFQVQPWDWEFYSDQVRKAKYDL